MGTEKTKNTYFILVLIFFIIIWGYLIYKIHQSKDKNLWDFRVYYYAVKVFEKGQNPYNLDELKKESNGNVELKFVYPPLTLYIFKIFSNFNYETAFDIYLLIKYILIIFLFLFWLSYFLEKENSFLFLIFSILGFINCIFADMATGNVSIFEQFFLWLGFYCWLNKKYIFFVILIFFASIFKFFPIFFLFLMLFEENKEKNNYLFAGFILIFLYILISFSFFPDIFKSYISSAISIDERGKINPAILPLIKDIVEIVQRKTNFKLFLFPYLIYFSVISIILIYWIKMILKFIKIKKLTVENKKIILFSFITLYTAISPRFKEYSYIIMLVPAFYIILKSNFNLTKLLLFIFFIMAKDPFIPIMNNFYGKIIWPYYLFYLTIFTLIMFYYYVDEKIKFERGKNENTLFKS